MKIETQLRKLILKHSKEEKRLGKVNEDPDKQYDWDAWMYQAGYVAGLRVGLQYLLELNKDNFVKKEGSI